MKRVLFLIGLVAVALAAVAGDITNYRTALVLAYSPANSVYEDDNLRLEIYNEKLWVTNKTNRAIFIDLSQCFAMHNGTSYPLFDDHKDEKSASKANASTTIEQFISIAPTLGSNNENATFLCNLAGGIYGEYTTTESPSGNFSDYEERLFSILNEIVNESKLADPKGKQYLGSVHRHLTEDESVNNIGASIAYAFNKRAEEWTPIAISTWVSDLYFAPYYVEMPLDQDKKKQRGFAVKKSEAAKLYIKADSPFEFDQDKSPVIVADWTGNFKKGKFELNPTWVYKKKGMNFGKVLLGTFATVATGGVGALLFVNDDATTFYKKSVIFSGADENWPGMTYFKVEDLSKFDNKRR